MATRPDASKARFQNILVFCDGASSGNPGPSGFGTVIATPAGYIKEIGRGYPRATNNQMELQGAIEALRYLREEAGGIDLFTDSVYLIRGITQWIWGWRNRGWKTAEGKDVQNADQWKELLALVTERRHRHPGGAAIQWHWVRGHQGVPGNERVDEIAVAFSKRSRIELFEGPLLEYPVALYDLPENTALPESSSPERKEKKAAFSYLSLVNGSLQRHTTWRECEARVKGRPGAKFKKAESPEDELKIVEAWGLPYERLPPRI